MIAWEISWESPTAEILLRRVIFEARRVLLSDSDGSQKNLRISPKLMNHICPVINRRYKASRFKSYKQRTNWTKKYQVEDEYLIRRCLCSWSPCSHYTACQQTRAGDWQRYPWKNLWPGSIVRFKRKHRRIPTPVTTGAHFTKIECFQQPSLCVLNSPIPSREAH